MLLHEELVKQFIWGLSILTAYLRFNNKINYTDINILSEGFICDLLNILYEFELKEAREYEPGYDLISEKRKIIVQVSTQCTPGKVNHTLKTLAMKKSKVIKLKKEFVELGTGTQPLSEQEIKRKKEKLKQDLLSIVDTKGYRVVFFFLCDSAEHVIKHGQKGNAVFKLPSDLYFSPEKDVLCFGSLIKAVKDLSPRTETEKIKHLKKFMNYHANLFIQRVEIRHNKVDQIVSEYAANFVEPLFLHRYQPETKVTLKNLFVEPSFLEIKPATISKYAGSIISILDLFLWGDNKDRLLFIDGDAALGKTSLISWLCYHYLELDDEGKSVLCNIQLVCVRLRDLIVKENETVESCLLRYLSFNELEEFEEKYMDALIILEGADELGIIGGMGSLTIEQFILNVRHIFFRHKIIITSRPEFINMDAFSGLTQSFTYQHYSLDHFSKEKRECWINNYEQPDKCGEIIPQYTRLYLNEITDDEASGVADTPLVLYLLAACEITAELRNNRWALYREIFHNAIRDTPYNESFNSIDDSLSHRALKEDGFAESIYRTIAKIANKMFEKSREDQFYLSSSELDDIIFKVKAEDNIERQKAIRKCCVLCAYWKYNTNIGALEFYHNNIRDFFMCEYIYDRFLGAIYSSNKEEIICQLIETACEVFQFGIIAQTTWEQTFSFLYFRLQYEKNTKKVEERIARKLHIKELFPSIVYSMVNNTTMWSYTYNELQYESIKSTFLNFVLFLRVWISAETSELLDTFSFQTDNEFWNGKGIFEDWRRIFSDSVYISENFHISFCSQTKFSNMDFKQANLENACFEKSKFISSSFENTRLGCANFSGTNLESVSFLGADLHDADFSNATLIGVDFSMANLHNAKFVNALIKDVIWPEKVSCLKSADFSHAIIWKANWKNWELNNIKLYKTTFEDCSFYGVQFFSTVSNATFNKCSITNSIFESPQNLIFNKQNSNISSISFRGNVKECLFKDLTINSSNWINASIDKINFVDVHMISTAFLVSSVKRISFDCCIIDSINVFKTIFKKSDLLYLKKNAKNIMNLETAKIYEEDISKNKLR